MQSTINQFFLLQQSCSEGREQNDDTKEIETKKSEFSDLLLAHRSKPPFSWLSFARSHAVPRSTALHPSPFHRPRPLPSLPLPLGLADAPHARLEAARKERWIRASTLLACSTAHTSPPLDSRGCGRSSSLSSDRGEGKEGRKEDEGGGWNRAASEEEQEGMRCTHLFNARTVGGGSLIEKQREGKERGEEQRGMEREEQGEAVVE